MYICYSSYKLREDLLHSRDRKSSMVEEMIVELVTLGQLLISKCIVSRGLLCSYPDSIPAPTTQDSRSQRPHISEQYVDE